MTVTLVGTGANDCNA